MKSGLRIVHTESSCGWGGQEMRILAESAGLRARGHSVQLLCPHEAPIFRAAASQDIPVSPLPIRRRNWSGFSALRKWLRDNEVDVVNTHSSTDSWLGAVAARSIRRRPVLVRTRHISTPVSQGPLTTWLYASGADVVVTTGERLRQTLITHNRLAPEHVVSVPTGVDTRWFAPGDMLEARRDKNLPADRVIIGIVATIRVAKGHCDLIDAIAQIPERHRLLLLVVGDGPNRPAVEQRVAERGLGEQVVMVGQQREVASWFRTLDIFAMPSYAEGVPQSILQAMSCELPVISTPVGSIPEAVVDGENGILVPPRTPAALAQALSRLIADPALRRRYGQEGRRRALARFTYDGMLERMEEIFTQICRRKTTLAA